MVVAWPDGRTTVDPPRVTSEFGMRRHPVTGAPSTMHYGIDMIGWSIIKSPVDGVVTFAGYNGGAGNEVRIRAHNGDVFRLMHNKEMWVRTGQRVAMKQDVAVMGTTGSSTGVHSHEETRPGGGNAINPRDYYRAANSGATPTPSPEEDLPVNVQIVLHKDSNQLLLVDHLNKTIRNLGASPTDPVRDYYSNKPYTVMNQATWATATKDYTYITIPTSWDAPIPARDAAGNLVKPAAAFPAAVYLSVVDAKINDMRANGVKATGVTITDEQAAEIADQIGAQVKGGATKAEVEGIVKAAFSALTLVTPE